MGAGASAGLAAAVAAANPEEVADVMKSLSDAEREKIAKALEGGGDSTSKQDDAALDAALTSLFKNYDLDNSGSITIDEALAIDRECAKVAPRWNEDEEESRKEFAEGDLNQDGKVVLSEFLKALKKGAAGIPPATFLGIIEQLNEALAKKKDVALITLDDALTGMFNIYDIDKSGFITMDEMLKMDKALSEQSSSPFDEEETKKSFSGSDENTDGKVSLQEFLNYVKKTAAGLGLSEEAQLGFVRQAYDMLLAAKV